MIKGCISLESPTIQRCWMIESLVYSPKPAPWFEGNPCNKTYKGSCPKVGDDRCCLDSFLDKTYKGPSVLFPG